MSTEQSSSSGSSRPATPGGALFTKWIPTTNLARPTRHRNSSDELPCYPFGRMISWNSGSSRIESKAMSTWSRPKS